MAPSLWSWAIFPRLLFFPLILFYFILFVVSVILPGQGGKEI